MFVRPTMTAALLAGTLLLAACTGHSKPQHATAAHTTANAAAVVIRSDTPQEQSNITEVTTLLTALPSQLAAGDTSALMPGVDAVSAGQARAALPAGSSLTINPQTWRRTGAVASVSVGVHPAVGPAQPYIAVLIQTPSGWKLSETVPGASK